MTSRESFEAFISAPPFEMPIERFDDRCAWPGSYTELEVDLAWQAWQAATDAALAAPAHPERKPMTDEKKEELAGAWFAEDWAKKSAIGMLDDYEKFNGIKP